ncbi:MAG: putative oxidoreductase [Gemmatimonadetes bacterium]|nr:putative oxidoreductase [Gemmatimonadota bacterium]
MRITAPFAALMLALFACHSPRDAGSTAAAATVAPAGNAARVATTSAGSIALSDSALLLMRADSGRIRGTSAGNVWLVMASDFQCPYCKMWHDESFAALVRDYVATGKIRMAYVNLPLESIHKHAREAAEAAMCASVQGRFWEMHDALFASQEAWHEQPSVTAAFDSLARASVPDVPAWRSCVATHATASLVDADRDRLTRAGIQSTPTFFVGGQKIEGAAKLEVFRQAIDRALAVPAPAR